MTLSCHSYTDTARLQPPFQLPSWQREPHMHDAACPWCRYRTGDHADAHEYLYGLLSAMHDAAVKESKPAYSTASPPRSLIHCIFGGSHLSQVPALHEIAHSRLLAWCSCLPAHTSVYLLQSSRSLCINQHASLLSIHCTCGPPLFTVQALPWHLNKWTASGADLPAPHALAATLQCAYASRLYPGPCLP